MRRWRRSTWVLMVAALVTVVGFATVITSVFRDQSIVGDFVRVPVGCEGVMTVDTDTTVYAYVETRGRIGDIGDCSNDDRSYDISGRPTPTFVVRSADDAPDFEAPWVVPAGSGVTYDLPEYSGRAVGSFTMEAGRRYAISVASDDLADVLAFGRRVVPVESPMAITGAVMVMLGVVMGIIGVVATSMSRRRRRRGPRAPPRLADRASVTSGVER
ncbi:MAG: hypothetical protein ACO3V4_05685 [Ilumatobacteraceae bacterium]